MKIVGVIPARYASSRFPGKPLADIHGKPMIWWVYQQALKVKELDDVVVATDSAEIMSVCNTLSLSALMTSPKHETPTARIHEVSCRIKADIYIEINGDEPMIKPQSIQAVIANKQTKSFPYVGGLFSTISNATDVLDPSNIKVVIDKNGICIGLSRSPIPFPKGSLSFTYKKYIGVVAFNKLALDLFVSSPKGMVETAEDVDIVRFMENGIEVHFSESPNPSISVDSPKDLVEVLKILPPPQKKLDN